MAISRKWWLCSKVSKLKLLGKPMQPRKQCRFAWIGAPKKEAVFTAFDSNRQIDDWKIISQLCIIIQSCMFTSPYSHFTDIQSKGNRSNMATIFSLIPKIFTFWKCKNKIPLKIFRLRHGKFPTDGQLVFCYSINFNFKLYLTPL